MGNVEGRWKMAVRRSQIKVTSGCISVAVSGRALEGLERVVWGKKGEGNALSQCRVCAAFQPAISAESSSALLSPPALQSQRRAQYFP